MAPSPRELAESAVEVSREAGKLLMSELPLGKWRAAVQDKGHGELVSRVDRNSEALIKKLVRQRHPDHVVLGEESGQDDDGEYSHRWIVDPLDGTTNFLHGHPFFAVSVAIERAVDQELVAAAVHVPYFSETYFAGAEEGAFMNSWSIPIRVSNTETLDEAVLATGFAYDRERYPNYDNFLRIAPGLRGVRRCGAAAIDLAFVACGRYDGFWELGLRIWDVAAGALLVREAGGTVCDFAGGDRWRESGNVVADNGSVGALIREKLDPPPHLTDV
jgi:myo-inositol-1(or 4)-monophosphatase